jgi:hypothetical protein
MDRQTRVDIAWTMSWPSLGKMTDGDIQKDLTDRHTYFGCCTDDVEALPVAGQQDAHVEVA